MAVKCFYICSDVDDIVFGKVKWYVWKKKNFHLLGFLNAILSALVNSYKMLDMIVFCDVLSIKACRRSKYIDLLFMLLSAIFVGLTFV
jgi:hypothetical protein